ncbi:uncharacterized protein N0V89_010848 [Didymosphaeria variabile]|uniref:Erythromycin biosynthesis protein CIII-like C-terminal domain-containing protein n=1 Tax=Didymosphaeria variabile TaxID=1932322 RepID=A0A9W8XCF4_9PLEO|nr:uncharacterized protein N0V89_010848 [Didymosphaeria variabile]KAJ4346915.1 hypothetical protein N0V89_010848 [Didymosphaeria variabile]
MTFFQKLFLFAFAPLAAFVVLREYSPGLFRALEDAIQPYIAGSPFSQYFGERPFARSEIPLLVSSVSHQSHFEKMGAIAAALAELGHPVTFICGKVFEDAVNKLHPNINFYPFQGLDDKLSEEDLAYWMSLPSGVEAEIWVTTKVIVEGAPDAHNTYQAYFKEFKEKYGNDKPLISLYDQTVAGHQTFLLGVPGIKPDVSIGISVMPLLVHSNDTYPARTGKKPHQGPNARAIHQRAYDGHGDQYEWEISKAWWAKLREMGSTRDDFPQILDGMNRVPDHLITMGVPEFEFPRTDLGFDLRYFGALRKVQKKSSATPDLPTWWDDLQQAKEKGRKIVAVSQGTVETKPEELILPTLEALKGRDDVLVIATFYLYEPEEVEGLVVPDNARVSKYIPHDELLPFVDVMVANGGYGAVQKCLMSGIPMVISGVGQDKAVVGALADFTGVGINLEAQEPGAERIKEAVEKILNEPSYRTKAKELSKAYDRYDMQREFDSLVQDVVRDWQKKRKSVTKDL